MSRLKKNSQRFGLTRKYKQLPSKRTYEDSLERR
jgi:hypothetical protein